MRTPLAHILSVAGHPALLLPLAAAFAAVRGGAPPAFAHLVLLAAGGAAALIVLYSTVQVVRGKWADTDASTRAERRELNLALIAVLTAAAIWLGVRGEPAALVLGFGLSAGIIAAALAASFRLKVSLHTGFAVFAAALFWPDAGLLAAGLALAAAIGWARLHLKRHTWPEVASGAALGALAGAILQAALQAP